MYWLVLVVAWIQRKYGMSKKVFSLFKRSSVERC
jgi:hypothetical protein